MNMEDIKKLCKNKKLRWTNHIFIRLIQRNINISDVVYAIMNGEIIEKYPDDYPYPSCLILGMNINNESLHIVCGINNNIELHLITVYYPNATEWTNDFKRRVNIAENGEENNQ